MPELLPNIHLNERFARVILGMLLWISLVTRFSFIFVFLIGLALIVEGVIGWCAMVAFANKMKNNSELKAEL